MSRSGPSTASGTGHFSSSTTLSHTASEVQDPNTSGSLSAAQGSTDWSEFAGRTPPAHTFLSQSPFPQPLSELQFPGTSLGLSMLPSHSLPEDVVSRSSSDGSAVGWSVLPPFVFPEGDMSVTDSDLLAEGGSGQPDFRPLPVIAAGLLGSDAAAVVAAGPTSPGSLAVVGASLGEQSLTGIGPRAGFSSTADANQRPLVQQPRIASPLTLPAWGSGPSSSFASPLASPPRTSVHTAGGAPIRYSSSEGGAHTTGVVQDSLPHGGRQTSDPGLPLGAQLFQILGRRRASAPVP